MKLVSMVDYVIDLMASNSVDNWSKGGMILKYANFLSQPLKLEQFVPCKDGVPLENPIDDLHWWKTTTDKERSKRCDEYQEAKTKVLFEGWKIKEGSNQPVFELDGYSDVEIPWSFRRGELIQGSQDRAAYVVEKTIEDLYLYDYRRKYLTLTPKAQEKL